MTKRKSGNYKFRKHDSIGANDAENDEQFLPFCFEDTGDLSTLSALDHPARIVLGRTGSGKSALLLELKRKHRQVIEIDPESLSLNFICNSTIIRFLSELGINLDPFYKLLWRHVLAITLLQARFEFTDEASTKASFLSILGLFESSAARQSRQAETERRRKAVAYLEKWGGGSFWKDVDVRTKEITSRFETEVTTRLANSIKAEGASITPFKAIVAGQRQAEESDLSKLSIEQRAEVKHYAQDVVNEIQVKELTGMLPFLDEVLTGAPTNYYVTIDRLDEKWVDDKLRYRLLKALVCLQIVCASEVLKHDQIYLVSDQRVRGTLSHAAARAGLAFIMFRTGAIGIKPDAASPTRWADNESYSLSSSEVTDDCRISIHPALWRALGVVQRPSL